MVKNQTTQRIEEQKTTIPPIAKYKAGQISGAVFEKEMKDKDRTFKVYSVNFQKGYKDKEGNWQNLSISLNKHDLASLRVVLNKAEEYLLLTAEEENK